MVAGCGIWWAAYSNAKNAMTQKWAGTAATVADEATLLASHVGGLQTILAAAQESETSPEKALVEQADAAVEEATGLLSALTENQESSEGLFTMAGHLGPTDPGPLFAAIPAHNSFDSAQSSGQSGDTGPQSGDRALPDITVMAAELGYIGTETTDIDEAQLGSQSIEFSPVDFSSSARMTQKDVDDLLRLSEDITTANNAVLNSATALLTGTYQARYETVTTGLSTQQKALTDAVTKAEKTLKDSDGRVADPGTRDALKKAIDKAKTTTGKELPVLISDVKAATKETKEVTDALTKATKAVTDSITAKQSAESTQAESTQYAGEQTSSDDYGDSYGSDDYQWDNSWNDYESNDYGWGGDSNSGGGGTSSPSGTTPGSSQGSSGGSQGGTPSGGGDDGSLFPDMCFITKPGSGEMVEVPC